MAITPRKVIFMIVYSKFKNARDTATIVRWHAGGNKAPILPSAFSLPLFLFCESDIVGQATRIDQRHKGCIWEQSAF